MADEAYQSAMEKLHVVTPLDPDSPSVRCRRDILAKYHQRLKEEAPYAYKPITPVVQSVEDAGIARRVARLWPLVTVKGRSRRTLITVGMERHQHATFRAAAGGQESSGTRGSSDIVEVQHRGPKKHPKGSKLLRRPRAELNCRPTV